jgi:inorganic pyrophosphatase
MAWDPVFKIDQGWQIVLPGFIGFAICLAFVVALKMHLAKQKTGKDFTADPEKGAKIDNLAAQVKSGARAFLMEEYKILGGFVVVMMAILITIFCLKPIVDGKTSDGGRVGGGFAVGALLSASAGWVGMMVATDGNSRTTIACATGTLNDGLTVAFSTGAIMGFLVVGLGLFGLSTMWLLLGLDTDVNGAMNPSHIAQVMAGFGFGSSSIALFARVAGGIYTKAADVGADLVGKVEAGIDEDDPHNPAVIADNVGDNVGDVAGMGADLFESYVNSIIAAATLGAQAVSVTVAGELCDVVAAAAGTCTVSAATTTEMINARVALPFYLAGFGVVASAIGYFCVSTKEEGKGWNVSLGKLMWALEKGMYVAAFLFVGFAALSVYMLFGTNAEGWKIFGCIIIGLVCGMAIGKITEYFTSFDFGPVISIKDRAITGPATVVIQGLGVGMISCVPPTFCLVATILACNGLDSGNHGYGIAISAVGMLSTLAITLSTDAYGPVADNAGGLAELSGLDSSVRNKTDSLDALGNTTAATGKGFAIGSAVLTSLSLLAAFKMAVQPAGAAAINYDVNDSVVLAGVIFGAMMPFLFAALTMVSVGKAAAEIIMEVRRQFDQIKNENGVTLRECIMKISRGETVTEADEVVPDSDKCVAISTRSSIREAIAPGAFAILAPIFIGLLVGPRMLMGMLAGSISSGCMMAIMMSNAGGAWDNSKKLCEKLDIKKTDQGKACVVGDTVGDPFKDTSGPALNILIKLMSVISLVIAPLLKPGDFHEERWAFGFIPFACFVILSAALVAKGILTWKDPLDNMNNGKQVAGEQQIELEVSGA